MEVTNQVNTDNNAETSIEALGEYVLIKQTMTKKASKIIRDASKSDKDKFDIAFEVLQLGNKCTSTVKVGDFPIFNEYVKFNLGRILEKTDNGMVTLLIVHESDIIGLDKNPNFKMEADTIPSLIVQ